MREEPRTQRMPQKDKLVPIIDNTTQPTTFKRNVTKENPKQGCAITKTFQTNQGCFVVCGQRNEPIYHRFLKLLSFFHQGDAQVTNGVLVLLHAVCDGHRMRLVSKYNSANLLEMPGSISPKATTLHKRLLHMYGL